MIGIELAEIRDSVFEIPPSRVRHAPKHHLIREEVEIDRRDLRLIFA